jgi:hypothetical protein
LFFLVSELDERRFSALGRVSGALADVQLLTDIARVSSNGWWNDPIQGGTAWPSDLTDDRTPFELSVQVESGRPELRILVEPRRDAGDPTGSFETALVIAGTLARTLRRGHHTALPSGAAVRTHEQQRSALPALIRRSPAYEERSILTCHAAAEAAQQIDVWNELFERPASAAK